MDKPIASEADTIASELVNAFSGVAKPHSVEVTDISNDDADQIIRHIFRYVDDVKNFYIPRILALTICANIEKSRRNEWIERLVDLLDVDLEEYTPGVDALLKNVRRETFSSYSSVQGRAIYHWLEFVRANYDCSAFRKEIDSAVDYWRKRASSTSLS
jgi:hypothetical protein